MYVRVTHAHIQARTYLRTCTRKHTHMHMYVQIYTYVRTHLCTNAMYICMHIAQNTYFKHENIYIRSMNYILWQENEESFLTQFSS